MYNFVIQLVIVLSLGVIIWLLARNSPRVNDESGVRQHSSFDRLISKMPLAKIDSALNSFLEKLLRKFKIVIMKVDNLINMYINKLRKNGKQK